MVEWAALEMRCTRKGTEGSNPSLTAKIKINLVRGENPLASAIIYINRNIFKAFTLRPFSGSLRLHL